ncbi:DUF659 domain-containing protein [Mycena venus]|uniref:DUF659 domain-containing protein n=1 Tax=Mycena venus TaxID=2733690 RepID=A0A8H6YAF0_9AGAR|nr:DUF659 domain-containing protein [Mycena venus]
MQSFRRQFQQKFFWVLTFACFIHSLNTAVGEIFAYPLIKSIITKANRTVTLFNGSHYWGGQLKAEAERLHMSRGLKKNGESRCYALILLCVSVAYYRQPLSITCLREDAKQNSNGCSAVAEDVINTALRTPNFWPLLRQVTRVEKPIMACWSFSVAPEHCQKSMLEDDEDAGFLAHAKEAFDRRFIKIATPVHWLALFLHPPWRKLALSGDSAKGQGKSLNFMLNAAFKIAQQW